MFDFLNNYLDGAIKWVKKPIKGYPMSYTIHTTGKLKWLKHPLVLLLRFQAWIYDTMLFSLFELCIVLHKIFVAPFFRFIVLPLTGLMLRFFRELILFAVFWGGIIYIFTR